MPTETGEPARRVGDRHPLQPRAQPERIHWSVLPELGHTELLTVENNEQLWRVYHEHYAICWLPWATNSALSRSEVRYRSRDLTLHRNVTIQVEPGELHVSKRMFGPRASFRVLQVPPALIADWADEFGAGTQPHLLPDSCAAPELIAALERFYVAFRRHEGRLELQTRLAEAMRLMFDHAGERRPNPTGDGYHPALTRARDYLHAHFADAVSLDELSGLTGLSRCYFVRSFHRAYGMPPHAYQVRIRVAAICDTLRRQEGIPSNLAGFYDQSHLGRHFKHVMGVTPSEYASFVGIKARCHASAAAMRPVDGIS